MLAIGLVTTVAGLLLAAEIADGILGCGSVDLTDPSNYSAVQVLNDTAHSVVVDDCRGAYCGPAASTVLAHNQRVTVHGACGASGTDMTSWRLTGAGGRIRGYIAIDTPRSTTKLTYRVSHGSSDRTHPAPPG